MTKANTSLPPEILNKLVQAEPNNADSQGPAWPTSSNSSATSRKTQDLRNSFLAAAYELRTGIPQGETASHQVRPTSSGQCRLSLFLNFLGIRMDSRKAEGLRFTINLVNTGHWREVHHRDGQRNADQHCRASRLKSPTSLLTINRSDLEQTMMGAKTLEAQIADGTAKVEGDVGILQQACRYDGRLRSTGSRSCRERRQGPVQ